MSDLTATEELGIRTYEEEDGITWHRPDAYRNGLQHMRIKGKAAVEDHEIAWIGSPERLSLDEPWRILCRTCRNPVTSKIRKPVLTQAQAFDALIARGTQPNTRNVLVEMGIPNPYNGMGGKQLLTFQELMAEHGYKLFLYCRHDSPCSTKDAWGMGCRRICCTTCYGDYARPGSCTRRWHPVSWTPPAGATLPRLEIVKS